MKRLVFGIGLVSLLMVNSAPAQEATRLQPSPFGEATTTREEESDEMEVAPSQVSPEMYLYLQELKRHDDPQQAVRRKAEARTAARMQRITAMKWFGMSNSRPQVNPVPFMGVYSPTWAGNGADRYDWVGIGWPQMSSRVEHHYYTPR